MVSCFLMGHRETSKEILPSLTEAVEHHITVYGVEEFLVGQYGGFDRLAISALRAAKAVHPEIILRILVPYHPTERPLELPLGFDSTYYPTGMERVPKRFAIVRANQYMVDHVDYLIAYVWHPGSNTMKLLNYARQREKFREIVVTQLRETA